MKHFRILWLLTAMMCCSLAAYAQGKGDGKATARKVLVLAERGGLHEGFTSAGLAWLEGQKERFNMELTVLNSAQDIARG